MPNNSIILPSSNIIMPTNDPFLDNVVFMINVDGPTLVDFRGHPLAGSGLVDVNTGVPGPFSPYSIAAAGGYFYSPDSVDWFMDNQDFSWEAWIRLSTLAGYQYILSQAAYGDGEGNIDFSTVSGYVSPAAHAAGANISIGGNTQITLNTWAHVQFDRFGSLFTAYLNGFATGSTTSSLALQNSTKRLTIGADNNGNNPLNGRIGPMRITKGVSRAKGSNFIPPNGPFPAQ